MYLIRIIDQMRGIGNIFRYLYESFSESAEMLEILDTPHEIVDKTNTELKVHGGRIDFQKIDFQYTPGKNIFDKLDLTIKPGEKVAIVGES
jgi:ATP-binding cassette subfamily B protein